MTDEPRLHKPTRLEALREALGQGAGRQVQRLVNSMHPAELASLRETLQSRAKEISASSGGKKVEFRISVEEGKPKVKATLS